MTRFFAIIFLAAAGLARAIVLKRDAGTVVADLGVIAGLATTLDNAINAFPLTGGTVDSALAIHNDVANFMSSVNVATSDAVAAGAFSEADGLAILNRLENQQNNLVAFANALIQDFPVRLFLSIPSLPPSSTLAVNPNHNCLQSDLAPQATAVRDSIVDAFARAIAAYSS
ncbi:hypothetical protein C8J57DRAFT_1088266 [Mycena rebaudengoi]|nr:hypothetical protein C8J57DRAFT_1088266 [Mycena rebaudengoi]